MNLSEIKGLGVKRIEKLASCGIYDPLDLLMLFPAKYYDRRIAIDWNTVADGAEVIFHGSLIGRPVFRRIRKGLTMVKAEFAVSGRSLTCTWFNQDYVFHQLLLCGERLICGKVRRFARSMEIVAPQLIAERDMDVMPIYKLPKGLTQSVVSDAVSYILEHLQIRGYIGDSIAAKYGLLPLKAAFRRIHLPESVQEAEIARQSIALENLAYTLSVYRLSKNDISAGRTRTYRRAERELNDAMNALSFVLTEDQRNAVRRITEELHSDHRMNLLLQGDVGSGKTVVAFLAMYYASLSGYQSALMAPTEILARQHYQSASGFFGRLGLRVCLLTGSVTKDREEVLEKIRTGGADIVIGTQALIGENVRFHRLGLTVTDEQHRFGVCQRGSLENKTDCADNIVMSATPIPRTLALTLYGQLQTVSLRSRPAGKNNTITAIVPTNKLDDMYRYIRNKAIAGEKTYIVCPRVDSEDTTSAVPLYAELSKGKLGTVGVGLLHGRQSEKEKAAVMDDFSTGKIMVLISTTVIEVGIDVKEASTMVIFGAEYFGLSQLHQLRGRVGRDGRESYCFIVQEGEPSERIRFLCECSDGFRLAEYDFDLRGAGDFLGTKQHGQNGGFAGIVVDAEMIARAKAIGDELLADPQIAAALAAGVEKNSEFIRSLSLS